MNIQRGNFPPITIIAESYMNKQSYYVNAKTIPNLPLKEATKFCGGYKVDEIGKHPILSNPRFFENNLMTKKPQK